MKWYFEIEDALHITLSDILQRKTCWDFHLSDTDYCKQPFDLPI
jgi:hypothetical protein